MKLCKWTHLTASALCRSTRAKLFPESLGAQIYWQSFRHIFKRCVKEHFVFCWLHLNRSLRYYQSLLISLKLLMKSLLCFFPHIWYLTFRVVFLQRQNLKKVKRGIDYFEFSRNILPQCVVHAEYIQSISRKVQKRR